jgi:hypothetical protein
MTCLYQKIELSIFFYLFQINKSLPKTRLIPILNEFSHYPEKYRPIIWRTILQLPQNSNTFLQLLQKGQHPCVINYDQHYPIIDQREMRTLKKIVSCLAHWSKIFSHCDYIGRFVFPFLRLFKNDSLLSFELIATILLNQCQLWFEYFPLEPFNYFGMIENVLAEFDMDLLQFYKSKDISSKAYGFALMENAFSEVLNVQQWYALWDHVITNTDEQYFYVFCIVAYSMVQKANILCLTTADAIKLYFHEQNSIDFKRFIGKAYELMYKCPDNIHPRQYMKRFKPLVQGHYQQFVNFPKMIMEIRNNELDTLKSDEKLLEVKMQELQAIEKTVNAKMEEHLINEEHQKRMAGKI